MIANNSPRGHSFKGLTNYLLTGSRGEDNPERVAWSRTGNLATENIALAAKIMAWTDEHAEDIRRANREERGLPVHPSGPEAQAGNVYHYSLSWKPGQEVDREEMERAALSSLERLKLSDHQFYMVAHNDTDHKHLHIVVNLVHPETGKINKPWMDFKTLDRWAYDYEVESGEVVCVDRAKKYEAWKAQEFDKGFTPVPENKRARGEFYKAHLSEAYQKADSPKAFLAALEERGLDLAQSDRGRTGGLVVVDERGDVYGLTRLIEGANKKDVSALLRDVDRQSLPKANELAQERARAWSDAQGGKDEGEKGLERKQQAQQARAGTDLEAEQEAKDAQRRLDRVIAAGLERTGAQRQPIFYERLNEIYHSGASGEQFREKIWKELNVSLTKDEKTDRFMLVDGRGRIYNLNTLIEVRDTQAIEAKVQSVADLGNQESVDRAIRSAKMSALEDRLSAIDKRQLETAQELSHVVKWSHYRNLPAKEQAIQESRLYWKVERYERAVEDAAWRAKHNEQQGFLWKTMNKQKIEEDQAELARQKGLLSEVKSRHADDVRAIYRSAPDRLREEKLEELQLKGYYYARRNAESSFDILEKEKKLALNDYKRTSAALQALEKQKAGGMFQGLSPGEAKEKERRMGQLRDTVELYEEHYGFHLIEKNKTQSQGQAQGLDAGQPGADSQDPQKDKDKSQEPLEDQAERFAQLQKDLQESAEEEQRRKRLGLDKGGPGKGFGI